MVATHGTIDIGIGDEVGKLFELEVGGKVVSINM